MLHHPFRTIGELLILDNIAEDEVVAATFREAYQLCREYHYHANHDIDGYGVSIDAGNDEFEDNREHEEPEENRGWEDLAVRRAEVREEDPDAIGKRDIDIMYDYTPHVGRYPDLDVGREYWVSLKSLNSAGDLQVPDQSLFARSLLAPQQRKVYDIVIDYYQQFLDGQMPRQFLSTWMGAVVPASRIQDAWSSCPWTQQSVLLRTNPYVRSIPYVATYLLSISTITVGILISTTVHKEVSYLRRTIFFRTPSELHVLYNPSKLEAPDTFSRTLCLGCFSQPRSLRFVLAVSAIPEAGRPLAT